ncbi:MAG: zonular occludens toxin domain-containing protein [Nanoarchaeota archaeon]|nr:hypothetical protein [Nanoarchaeota archaeon]MBU1631627.1 hypothetical protein [Nanoarchaeota archaeon]MBU1876620.1 hypothetical protein [Nanoarchaeota archaeon]
MKKKTKKKITDFLGKIVRGIFKLILIYPFKLVWFLLKQLYYTIKSKPKHKKNDKDQKNKNESNNPSNKGKKIIGRENKKQKEQPTEGKIKADPIIDDLKEIKCIQGNFESFQKKIYHNKSTVGLIIGARGTGKSAVGMRLLENFKVHTTKNIYAMGFKAVSLPDWITVINDVEDIENNSVLLIDEGGIEFSSRKSMSDANTILSEILLIARHKDLSVIFITQNSSNLEINVIRQADYLILKPSSLLQIDFERKKIKEIYEKAKNNFEKLKEVEGLTYIYADNYHGFVTNTLPSFWSENVSKGYAKR